MSRKSKGVILESTPPYDVGGYDDAKNRMKHRALMQEYHELQREVDFMRSKLQAGKQRKRVLTAEVRFLRRRHECFVKTETMNSIQNEKLAQLPDPTQSKSRKEAGHFRLPLVPQSKSRKKHCIGKEVAPSSASQVSQLRRKIEKRAVELSFPLVPDFNDKGRVDIRKTSARNITPALDLNKKERMQNETALKNTIVAFDLNRDNSLCRKEASLPSRAPVFDLNEISTGDEDVLSNHEAVISEDFKKSLTRCPNDEVQNDLKLSICRNAGDGPSRAGKRKISWQDPVALRV
ncbi:hypothetical protein Salat_0949900 [Sesamum alatum]|uniref:Uncharacterized protein n=1 Tax=Sesamum alatum TaxID=300844 RepID=A0AAE1YLN2_9LAMI|nr:hypothetical protein Salat_0949900 [Sesamum alatum]